MHIPIVMVSDAGYISQTRVTVWTMRKSTSDEVSLHITILCPAGLGEDERRRLTELEGLLPNLKIAFYEVDARTFADARPVSRIPVTSFYRLVMTEVFQEEDQCLFLDGDLIVRTDLRNLYLQDLGDACIAGVRDGVFRCAPDLAVRHFQTYGFSSPGSYVNAGVLVVNLAKLRREGVKERFLACMKREYPYMDQDILNKVCDGSIRLLEPEYNYFSWNRKESIQTDPSDKREQTSMGAAGGLEESWRVFHFIGSDKPWNHLRVRGGRFWWKAAEEALEEEVYRELYREAEEAAAGSDWSYLLGRCLAEQTVVIAGYSNIGTDVYTSLRRGGVTAELFFCDNSEAKQSLSDKRRPIYSVEEAALRYPEALWINTSQQHHKEICAQLRSLGIKEERILRYIKKGEAYFEMLDDAYLEHELKEARLKALGRV